MSDFLFRNDTIGAISTPPGRSAIGIIRLSGPDIERSLARHWKGRPYPSLSPRRLTLGSFVDGGGRIVDEVLLCRMEALHSYTGEEMAEVHTHGNPSILGEILRLLVEEGVRAAEPGEFTFRAFRNGRMSLLQAEAVAELIEARGSWARQNALSVLAEGGDIWVEGLLGELLEIWAPIEADLEFPTDDLDSLRLVDFIPSLKSLHSRMEDLSRRAIRFSKLQEGYRVVIVGAPNAGKSSLLNALLGYSRAMVTEIPGTTRDTLEENFEINGVPIRLIDTAGLGEAVDRLEAEGMERTRQALETADLALVLVDASVQLPPPSDWDPTQFIPGVESMVHAPYLSIANKQDLVPPGSEWEKRSDFLLISAKEGRGMDVLVERIGEVLIGSGVVQLDERLMLNQRQSKTLARARDAIARCIDNIEKEAPQDLAATDLVETKHALEELSGKTMKLDLMETIFSRFCIGK